MWDARSGGYEFEILVHAGAPYPTPDPVSTLTITAIRHRQRRLGLPIYELTHATARDSGADLEIVFDPGGGARTVTVTPQHRQERATLWLNENSPTFLETVPPAMAGADRFRLTSGSRTGSQKRLTDSMARSTTDSDAAVTKPRAPPAHLR